MWAEFLCGPASDAAAAMARVLLGEPVALGPAQAERAARLFNGTGRRRGSFVDCLVAVSPDKMRAVCRALSIATACE